MGIDEPSDPSNLYAHVGACIREWRLKRGLNQGELAARVSLARTSITNIEAGRQKTLLHTFVDIARALGVEPALLLPPPSSEDEILRNLPKQKRKFAVQIKKQARNRTR